MNAIERLAFANSVKLVESGDYEGLPVPGTDVSKLAECIGIAVGTGGEFTQNHLKAYQAMAAQAAKDAARQPSTGRSTGGNAPKLKWAKFDDKLLSSDAQELYAAYRAANVAAAKCRTEFEELALPEIHDQIVKATGKPLPAGKGIVVTYKFGRINAAVGDATEVTKSQADLGNLY